MQSPSLAGSKIARLSSMPLLMLCAALAACSKSSHEQPSQLAARVNKAEISVHQINYTLSRQPGLPPQEAESASRRVLEGLIDQEVAVQQAVERKLDRDPGVMQALSAARREVLARAFAENVAATATKPSAPEIKTYYDTNPALFSQRRIYALQEVTVQANGATLESLRERVRTAKTMQEVSDYLKESKLPVQVGQSTAPAENLPMPLLDVLLKARDGQALFLPAPGGARIIVVSGHRDAPVTLEQATPAIEQALLQQQRRKLVDTEVQSFRKNAQVEYVGKFAQAAAPAPQLAASATAAAAVPTQQATEPGIAAVDAASVDPSLVRRGLGAVNK